MQPVVVSSAHRQDLWEAGGVAIEVGAVEGMVVVAVEGMVVVAVEGMVVVAVEGMELCRPAASLTTVSAPLGRRESPEGTAPSPASSCP